MEISNLIKCPIFKEILSKDWKSIAEENGKLLDEINNKYIEYNIPKSAQHPTSEGENVR